MYLESFRHLIEIEALKKANINNLSEIEAEKKRISALVQKKSTFTEEITQFKQDILALRLKEIEGLAENQRNQIKKLNGQLLMIKTLKEQTAIEDQIKDHENKANLLEEEYFLNLEKSEELLLKIEGHQNFLLGVETTLKEIEDEVNIKVTSEEKIINERLLRINSLLDQCRDDVKTFYFAVEKQLSPKKHTSFLINKKCGECHMQTDSSLKNNLEAGISLEVCPHCGRFLIPETSRIY